MKNIAIVFLALTALLSAWNLEEVIDSEGTQTNIIKCNNGKTKAVYFNSKSTKYEVTPTLMFETLEEASQNVCGE